MPKVPNKINRSHDAARMLDQLPRLVFEARESHGLSLRDAADQIGVSFNTLHRLERGVDVRTSAARKVLAWLGN